jgi:beta-lactamase class A
MGYGHHVNKTGFKALVCGVLALAGAIAPTVSAQADDLERAFDRSVGLPRPARPVAPRAATVQPFIQQPVYQRQSYSSPLEAQIAALAGPEQGRIGVAAIDLSSGRSLAILGSQPFPLASTSKIAVVATFLEGVDEGRFRLSDQYPLMVPVASPKFSSAEAPSKPGAMVSAERLIELAITRSDNNATDALLAAIGGPREVNRWLSRAGISGMRMDRTIATLVRDDGAINPAVSVDLRDSSTPQAMVRLLSGLYQGQWLSPESRSVLLGAMSRCATGKNRMRALLPEEARISHKTGTLSNTASDVGIIETPDGRAMAVAVYVTGQGGKPGREARIASITRAIYDGYRTEPYGQRFSAAR